MKPNPLRYRMPNGQRNCGFRWTIEEQELLRSLSPKGTVADATRALHLSLPPSLDGKGRYFTTAMRRALPVVAQARALPLPHPDRPTPEEIKAEEDRLQDLRKRIALTDRHNHYLLAVISEQMRQRDAVAA